MSIASVRDNFESTLFGIQQQQQQQHQQQQQQAADSSEKQMALMDAASASCEAEAFQEIDVGEDMEGLI